MTSLSTVALYLAYVIPVVLGLRARSRAHPWTTAAVWSLGRRGRAVNIVAIVYTAIVSVVLIMPPNQLAGQTLLCVLGILAIVYRVFVRHRFAGPDWAREPNFIKYDARGDAI